MIRVRVFNKTKQVEFSKYFINEYYAFKYMRKLRHSTRLQVIGNMQFVKRSEVYGNE